MTIVTRAGKQSELSHNEMDTNFTDLRDGVNLMTPKTKGKGMKLGPNGSETFGWHDLTGILLVYALPGEGTHQIYRGGIHAIQLAETEHAHCDFHMPHDYAPGTDIFIHVHWSHAGTLVTGGSVTWGFEIMYAKGHNQEAFPVPLTVSVAQNASTTQYQHMIAEGLASTPGGSGVLLDTNLLETDGIIQCRISLDSNDMIVSGGLIPDPFIHMVDLHYQSTNTATKNRSPDFWA